jgi:hypothetical protein
MFGDHINPKVVTRPSAGSLSTPQPQTVEDLGFKRIQGLSTDVGIAKFPAVASRILKTVAHEFDSAAGSDSG